MRRFVSYLGIILLALLVSGGSSVIAAAFCPHAGMNQALPVAEDNSCHRAPLEAASEHPQGHHREAAPVAQMKPVAAPQFQASEGAALGQPTGTCAHCISQSELPAMRASVRQLTLQQRDAGKLIGHTPAPNAPPATLYVSQFSPVQHAPPGLAARRHLIFSVFLI